MKYVKQKTSQEKQASSKSSQSLDMRSWLFSCVALGGEARLLQGKAGMCSFLKTFANHMSLKEMITRIDKELM